MLRIIDTEQLGYATLKLDAAILGGASGGDCSTCLQYRTEPQLDGNLQVDPEIFLPSPGMDVDIAYYYNSNATMTSGTIFGLGRTVSTNLLAQASGAPLIVTLTRGNGSLATYQHDGSGGFGPTNFSSPSQGNVNTLQKDTAPTPDHWLETVPNGTMTAYPVDTTGAVTSIVYAQDAIGNRHTFSYASGLLNTLQDAVGRLVSFVYDGNSHLQSIQDWAGRITTFQYDTSIPARPVLSTVIGPSGCQTAYGYDAGARLTSITDPNGYATTYAYDSANRVFERTVATAGTTRYSYTAGQTVITQPDGAIVTNTLSSEQNIAGITDALGIRTTLAYNAQGLQVSSQDYYGAITTTSYDANNIPTATTDALGRITTYSRDAYNNATQIAYPDGTLATMLYAYGGSPFDTTGAKRRLQVSIDPLDNRTSYAYNGRGQMLSVQNALGAFTTLGYDSFGNQISATDPLGNISTSVYDLAGNVIASINALGYASTTTYDPQNRPILMQDSLGYVSTMAYDGVGNLLVSIDALGRRTSSTYDVFGNPVTVQDALGGVTTHVYDSSGRPVASINALGYASTIVYDAAGRVLASVDAAGYRTSTVYDATGRPVASIDALGFRTSMIYDLVGRTVASIDQLGCRTTITYDLIDRPLASTDALGRFTTMVYDTASRMIASIDASGYRTSAIYDAVGRPLASVDALGRRSTSVYDVAGRMTTSIDALGFRTSFAYDATSRMIGVQDAVGVRSTTVYDARGQQIASVNSHNNRTTYSYDAAGQRIQMEEMYLLGAIQRTTWVYDAGGRSIAMVDALSYRTTNVYDALGKNTAQVDALGRRTTTSYNGLRQVASQQDARGFRTTLSYDALGRNVVVEDADGNRTSSVYDSRGFQTSSQNAWGAFTTLAYDAVGNTTSRADGRGWNTTYSYDALDRMTGTAYADGTRVTSVYDTVGQQSALWDKSGITSTTYDAVGQLIRSAAQNAAGITSSLSYTYDGVGSRLRLQDAENRRITYSYAGISNVAYDYVLINAPYESDYLQVRFDSVGGIDRRVGLGVVNFDYERTLANGWTQYHRYIQPDDVTFRGYYIPGYDKAGNVIQMQEIVNATSAASTFTYFSYDASNQLLSERRVDVPGYAHTYTYDGTGNRLTKHSLGVRTTYSYAAGNRLLSEQTGTAITTYSYDGNGNTVLINAANALTTYSWDGENRLTGVVNSDGSSEAMSYGADGLRKSRTVTPLVGSPVTTNLVWDGQSPFQERDGAGLLLAQHVYGPGSWHGSWAGGELDDTQVFERRVLTPGDLSTGVTRYLGTDPSFNTRILIDSSGAVTDRMSYSAFGELWQRSGSTDTSFLFGGALGYISDAARRKYVRARVLDPQIGRWSSVDPIGFDGGDWNLFGYVRNNPISGVDPSGLEDCWRCAKLCMTGRSSALADECHRCAAICFTKDSGVSLDNHPLRFRIADTPFACDISAKCTCQWKWGVGLELPYIKIQAGDAQGHYKYEKVITVTGGQGFKVDLGVCSFTFNCGIRVNFDASEACYRRARRQCGNGIFSTKCRTHVFNRCMAEKS